MMRGGTTFERNAPVDMGRAIHVEPIALIYPNLVLVLALTTGALARRLHRGFAQTILVFCEISALFDRPKQYISILMSAQEYRIIDKIFFGTDFPFVRVEESIDGLLGINDQLGATNLPRVDDETMQHIFGSN